MSKPNLLFKRVTVIEGFLMAAIAGFVILLCLPVTTGDHFRPTTVCLSNTKQMATGFLLYSSDFDDRLPAAKGWMDTISPYSKSESAYHCPLIKEGAYGYAMNDHVALRKEADIKHPEKIVLVFDSDLLGRSAHGTLASLPNPGRHEGGNNCAYVDGHARHIRQPSLASDTASDH